MTQRSGNALLVLRLGLQTEEDGIAFYSAAADRASLPEIEAIFRALAGDEATHKRILEEQEASLRQGRGWRRANPPIELPSPSGIFRPEKLANPEIFTSALNALRMAIRLEQDAIRFYMNAASQVKDANARSMFAMLAQFETAHKLVLMGQYDILAERFEAEAGFEPF